MEQTDTTIPTQNSYIYVRFDAKYWKARAVWIEVCEDGAVDALHRAMIGTVRQSVELSQPGGSKRYLDDPFGFHYQRLQLTEAVNELLGPLDWLEARQVWNTRPEATEDVRTAQMRFEDWLSNQMYNARQAVGATPYSEHRTGESDL